MHATQSCRPVRSPNCTANNDRQNRVIRLPYRPTCQTGRPAKPAFNSRNFSFTCHTHSVFGDSSPGIVPLKRLCLTLRCFPTIHAHVQHVHARAYKGVEARHRHTDTDVEWRVAHEKVDEGIFSEQTLQDRLSIAGLSRIHATSSRRLFLWTYTVLGHVFSTLHLT